MTSAPGAALAPPARPRGRVRIVAHPWAEIWVDGKLVDTTPTAAAVDLEAGAHALVLKNPYFAELKRDLTVAPGDAADPQIFTLAGRKVPPRQVAVDAPRPVGELARSPVLLHTVRRGDTIELLAAEYYGRRDFAVYVLLANGLARPRTLKPGEKVSIPTAWRYKIVEGDTFSGLAKRLLGDERRAAFLADINHVALSATLAIGDEIVIPYHGIHVAASREDVGSLAATFYGDRDRAEMLRRYNFRTGRSLAKGDSIIIPLTDVRARLPEDPESEKRARQQREMTAKARDALTRAQEAWRVGDYEAARSALVPLDHAYLDADLSARAAFLLASAYIALGDRDSALRELTIVRDRRPDFIVRADETSPKIGDAWKKAGGRVEDPR